MTTEHDLGPLLEQQIRDALDSHIWRLGALMPHLLTDETTRHNIGPAAQRLAAQLQCDDDKLIAQTAQDICMLLWRESDPPAEWWRTPLGRAVAMSYGVDGSEAVTPSIAGAMLGVSPQRVWAMIKEGKLERHPDGGVTRVSVVQRLTPVGGKGA